MSDLVKRGKGGRFEKGTKAGPGNPLAAKVIRAKAKLYECVKLKDIEEVYEAVQSEAAAGDMQAARLFFEYIFGKPSHAYDPRQAESNETEPEEHKDSLRDQEIFLCGMLAHVRAQLRAGQEGDERDE